MFINTDAEPPEKSDVHVEVSFPFTSEEQTNLRLSAKALVVRVQPAVSGFELRGFAILNRSYKLINGKASVDEGDSGFEFN